MSRCKRLRPRADCKRRLRKLFGRYSNGQPQLADAACALRPLRLRRGQQRQMIFIRKPRDRIVGLRLQVHPRDAALGMRREEGQAPVADKIGAPAT